MRDRRVRLGMVGLILGFPPLIEAMSPGLGESWAASAARVALVELVVVAGMLLAARQRRRLLAGWHVEQPSPAPAMAMRTVAVTVAASPRRRAVRGLAHPATVAVAPATAS